MGRNSKIIKKNNRLTISALGDQHSIILDGRDTENQLSFIEQTYEVGKGSSLHSHKNDCHIFYVLEGRFKIRLDDIENEISEGDTAYIPKGTWHSFVAVGDITARVLVLTLPAGLENLFIALSKIENDKGKKIDIHQLASQFGILLP